MSTVGNTTTPSAGYDETGTGGWAAATEFTMPSPGGIISSISGYFDGVSGGPTGYVVIWDYATGSVLASVNVGALANGTVAAGGQQWYTGTLGTPIFIANGKTIWIGFVSSNDLLFSSETGGSSYVKAMSSPGAFTSPASSGIGAVGAYATYTPGGGVKIYNGTSWVESAIYVNTGTPGTPVQTPGVAAVNTGTPGSPVWTPGA